MKTIKKTLTFLVMVALIFFLVPSVIASYTIADLADKNKEAGKLSNSFFSKESSLARLSLSPSSPQTVASLTNWQSSSQALPINFQNTRLSLNPSLLTGLGIEKPQNPSYKISDMIRMRNDKPTQVVTATGEVKALKLSSPHESENKLPTPRVSLAALSSEKNLESSISISKLSEKIDQNKLALKNRESGWDKALKASLATAAVTTANDGTVIGVVDDPLIPLSLLAAGIAATGAALHHKFSGSPEPLTLTSSSASVATLENQLSGIHINNPPQENLQAHVTKPISFDSLTIERVRVDADLNALTKGAFIQKPALSLNALVSQQEAIKPSLSLNQLANSPHLSSDPYEPLIFRDKNELASFHEQLLISRELEALKEEGAILVGGWRSDQVIRGMVLTPDKIPLITQTRGIIPAEDMRTGEAWFTFNPKEAISFALNPYDYPGRGNYIDLKTANNILSTLVVVDRAKAGISGVSPLGAIKTTKPIPPESIRKLLAVNKLNKEFQQIWPY